MRLSEYPCIYIQIPKTGTGSYGYLLQQEGGHRTASWIRAKISEEEWKNRWKFALVRHPFDRFVSICSHFKLDVSAEKVFELTDDIRIPRVVLESQSWFLDEEIDYIGRFEHFADEWEVVRKKLNIELPLAHRNHHQHIRTLTERDKAFLYEKYQEDFNRFGYNPEYVPKRSKFASIVR